MASSTDTAVPGEPDLLLECQATILRLRSESAVLSAKLELAGLDIEVCRCR